MADYSFQAEAVRQVMDALETHQRVLLQAPTGAGKTRMAMEIARRSPRQVLFIAEAKEIVRQSVDAFKAQGLLTTALTANSITSKNGSMLHTPYVIAAQRTAWSRGVNKGHDIGDFNTIIVDEAHHVRARTYEELLALWPAAKVVLLTATPVRGDGKGLGNIATAMVQGADYGGNYSDLIASGVLVPSPRELCWTWPVSMKGVKSQAGDYAMGGAKGASRVMDTPKLIGDIVEHWLQLAEDRQTIVYATSVDHARNLEVAFRDRGVAAGTVYSAMDPDDRIETLETFKAGILQVVTNFGVLTEGFDHPDVSCIVLCRPTKQIGLYIQMVGRGLRQAPGKKDLLLLDHTGIVLEHGMPGTDMDWQLSETDDAAPRPARLKACPQCSAVLNTNGNCDACGYQKPQGPRVWCPLGGESDYEGDRHDLSRTLSRLSDRVQASIRDHVEHPGRTEYRHLIEVAKRRGWKRKWARFRYKDKHGEWPAPEWDLPNPLTVTPAEFLHHAENLVQEIGWKPGAAKWMFKRTYGEFPQRKGDA